MAVHRSGRGVRPVPAVEAPRHGAAHQGGPRVAHPIHPPHHRHHRRAHDRSAGRHGHRACDDPDGNPGIPHIHQVEETNPRQKILR